MKKILFYIFIFVIWVAGSYFSLQFFSDDLIYQVAAIAIITLIMLIIIVRFSFHHKNQQIDLLERRLKDQNIVSYRVRQSGNESFNKLPIGIIILDADQSIEWINNYAKNILRGKESKPLIQEIIQKIKEDENFLHNINDSYFTIIFSETANTLYFFDANKIYETNKKYIDSQIVFGEMILDNFDETLNPLDVQEKSEVMSIYIGAIADWTNRYDMYLKSLSDERFIFLCKFEKLNEIMEENFSILHSIRDLSEKNDHKITVSIGVSTGEENVVDLAEKANDMLNMALDRGGDQAVLSIGEEIKYFGATVQSQGKKSRVKARTFAQTLRKLMSSANNVVIAPHKYPDADAFGASVAVHKMAKFLNKEVKILTDLNEVNPTLNKIVNNILNDRKEILDDIVDPEDGKDFVNEDTLLVIVDCQLKKLVINEKIMSLTDNIVIIDHHRRSTDSITDALEQFIEPYASSSVELMTEILTFFDSEITISPQEATLMLTGIIVDTNNFTHRTGARTFHAASYLIQAGADSEKVQALLREDIDELVFNNRFLSEAKLINNKYLVAKSPDLKTVVSRETLAKASNRLLTVDNVDAAFSIGLIDKNTVGISARSFGSVNVQVIMEKLGGGGHLNNAATQIKNITIEKAFEKLIDILEKLD